MQKKCVGKSGVTVSEIALGTWAMGGTYWGPSDDAESIRAIHAALDHGINMLDTAEAYNDGYSERVIGRAIAGRKDQVVISTKAANYHSSYKDVKAACERSLKNLGRDYVDIYFLHWPSTEFGHEYVPFEETLQGIAELKAEGKIRAFGLSNFQKQDFEFAAKHVRVDAYQPPFNLLWRAADEMIDFCYGQNIAVFPYASVAQGLLTGMVPPNYVCGEGDKRCTTPLFQPENMKKAWDMVVELRRYAEKYEKTLVQFVLRWMLQKEGITAPLVGGRTDREIEDGVGATGWLIEKGDWLTVDSLSRAFYNSLPRYRNYFSTEILRN